MASTEAQRWARVPPRLAWKRLGLPIDWVPVLERHPHPVGLAGHVLPLPGYVWLSMPGKVRHVGEHELEFRRYRAGCGPGRFPLSRRDDPVPVL